MKLHLGCGNDYRKGYLNLDSSSQVKTDKVWNLEKTPLPFKNNQFEEVLANHVLEHVNNFIPLIHELHRISKKNAKIIIRTPFYSAWGQFNDPTRVRFFTPWTFDYFNRGNYSHEVGADKDMFKINKVRINFGIGYLKKLNFIINPLINISPKIYCRFFAWTFPASEMYYELEVLK
jgi:hypothetical protein